MRSVTVVLQVVSCEFVCKIAASIVTNSLSDVNLEHCFPNCFSLRLLWGPPTYKYKNSLEGE